MNERIQELAEQAIAKYWPNGSADHEKIFENFGKFMEIHAELIVRECAEQVEQAKNSPFVSLDDAKRMKHFVDVTKKKIKKHFGVE